MAGCRKFAALGAEGCADEGVDGRLCAGSLDEGDEPALLQHATSGDELAAGDGYTVQAVSDLYRLKWNPEIADKFATEIMEKNGTLQDLINAGICQLEYVGSEKASSNIRQSLFSDKPISQLVERATARAIDEAIVKLQNGHEEFRTVFPIIGGDGEVIYAPIGTKESLNEKDTALSFKNTIRV